MKKVVLSMVMCAALLASSAVMAQNGKTEVAPKKTEVKSTKTEAKPVKTEKKTNATKTEEPKKAACASSKAK